MGEPVLVGALTTPVDAMVEEATPEDSLVAAEVVLARVGEVTGQA